MLLRREHGADGVDGTIEPARHFPIGGFEVDGAGANRVEFRRELGAVAAEGLKLSLKGIAMAIFLVPSVDRGLEGVQRRI